MPLPLTKTRLASSLSIIAIHQTTDTGVPFDTTDAIRGIANLAEFASSLTLLGATRTFRPVQNSNNQERRGINAGREAFAVAPGPITTTIEMERAVLYSEDALGGFKFLPGNIAFQTRPLIIIENVTTPTTDRGSFSEADVLSFLRDAGKEIFESLTSIQATPLLYLNCWIRESRISYDLKGSDLAVFQNLTMNVGRITTPAALLPRIGEPVTRTLAQNSSIIGAITRAI